MNKLTLAGCALLIATPVLAQSIGEKTGLNKLTGTSPSTADFLKEVAISDMFEIQSSQLAQTKADPAAKAFAAHMIQDHTKTSADLKGMVSSGKVNAELPSTLDSSHQSELDKLKGLNGADFTKEYDSAQLSGHKDAVSLFERYSKGGDNPDLKQWAADTLPKLQGHLKMAEDLGQ